MTSAAEAAGVEMTGGEALDSRLKTFNESQVVLWVCQTPCGMAWLHWGTEESESRRILRSFRDLRHCVTRVSTKMVSLAMTIRNQETF